MAKYIHIPRLDRGDLGLCGCHTYHLIHGFCVKNKNYWNGKPICPKCHHIGVKFPQKVHFWKPFKNRETFINYFKFLANK